MHPVAAHLVRDIIPAIAGDIIHYITAVSHAAPAAAYDRILCHRHL
jgi:hypothetical protein